MVEDHGKEALVRIALAGNPNSGKSCIFNALTGSNQHIGNYPGVTVEKKEGFYTYKGKRVHVVDLPGTYSLTSYSQEEVVARRFLVEHPVDVVVDVVDASNLERNLYLTIQLLELGLNLVVVLNMMDEVRKQHISLDTEMMSKRLGCPMVETVGHQGVGVDALKEAILKAAEKKESETIIQYRGELGQEMEKIKALLPEDKLPYPAGFAAAKLLEADVEVTARCRNFPNYDEIKAMVERSSEKLTRLHGFTPEVLFGDRRYGFASGLVKEITSGVPTLDRLDLTEKIDAVVTSRLLGFPIFLATMYLIFWLTFTLGTPLMDLIDNGMTLLGNTVGAILPANVPWWIRSFLLDGVIGGVGGVIVFLPNILILFAGISFMEDTGYMARIAFIMDKVMHKIGLHGRSFIPLMIGFGCTVPAIMATRIIRSRRGRFTTIMILPLMSCGARLTIYLMIIPAFFSETWQAPVLLVVYLLGVLLAVLVAKVLRNTLFKGESEPFVMELPPYRLPTVRSVLRHMWFKSWMYLKKAGTIILGFSILMWFLLSFPVKNSDGKDSVSAEPVDTISMKAQDVLRKKENLDYSFAGRMGRFMEPLFEPMGFDWRIGTSFIGAFAAKELFVSQMSIIYSMGEESGSEETLRTILKQTYSPLTGFCILIFALIATPCMATLAVTRKETGSWKWAFLQWGGLTMLGWIVTVIIYQSGRFVLQ